MITNLFRSLINGIVVLFKIVLSGWPAICVVISLVVAAFVWFLLSGRLVEVEIGEKGPAETEEKEEDNMTASENEVQ